MNAMPRVSEMERAFLERDASYDGLFFLGMRTTGIFCRPTCPARKPRPENVEYFPGTKAALAAVHPAYVLIDEFLPQFDFAEHHGIAINATTEQVNAAVRTLDLSSSKLIRWLFRLRGLPASSLTLEGLLRMGFIPLGETPSQETLLGAVGKFWTRTADLQRLAPASFREFDRAGYAKAAWNFALDEQSGGVTRLTPETRIYCTDPQSRRRFRLYWSVIGPSSAWIRRETLRILKERLER